MSEFTNPHFPSTNPETEHQSAQESIGAVRTTGWGLVQAVRTLHELKHDVDVDADVARAALNACPYPLTREELLYETVRVLRQKKEFSQAEELLLGQEHVIAAVRWREERNELEEAQRILRESLILDRKVYGGHQSDLLEYLCDIELRRGNAVVAVDALVESGNFSQARDTAREYGLDSRKSYLKILAENDLPHSWASSMAQGGFDSPERLRRAKNRSEILPQYRALEDYSFKNYPWTRAQLADPGQDENAKQTEQRLLWAELESKSLEQIANDSLILACALADNSGDRGWSTQTAKENGDRAKRSGNRHLAALIYAQGHESLNDALYIASRPLPPNRSLLEKIAERVNQLSEIPLESGRHSSVSYSHELAMSIGEGCTDLIMRLSLAGDASLEARFKEYQVRRIGGPTLDNRFLESWDVGRMRLAELLTQAGATEAAEAVRARLVEKPKPINNE